MYRIFKQSRNLSINNASFILKIKYIFQYVIHKITCRVVVQNCNKYKQDFVMFFNLFNWILNWHRFQCTGIMYRYIIINFSHYYCNYFETRVLLLVNICLRIFFKLLCKFTKTYYFMRVNNKFIQKFPYTRCL